MTERPDESAEDHEAAGQSAREITSKLLGPSVRELMAETAARRGKLQSQLDGLKMRSQPLADDRGIGATMKALRESDEAQRQRLEEATEARRRREREKIEREVRSVELATELLRYQEALVAQQQALVEQVEQQAEAARTAETRERWVIAIAAATLVVSIIGVAIAVLTAS